MANQNIYNSILLAVLLSSVAKSGLAETKPEGWRGQGEVGLVKASGNTDSENFNIGLDFFYDQEIWHHEMSFDLYRASSDGIETAESFAADVTSKRDLSKRRFIFANLSYLDDSFDGFTEQASGSVGIGYRVIESDLKRWELAIGAGYRDTSEAIRREDGSETEGKDLSGATLVFRSDFAWKVTSNTQFLDSFKADVGSENSYFENDAGLVVSMNDAFALKVGLLVRHNTDPAPGADETDTISSLNLIYNFGVKK